MIQSKGSVGHTKHRMAFKSHKCLKNPKMRQELIREAKKNDVKSKSHQEKFSSVSELFKSRG